jgi:hypothetical protein
LAGGDIYSDQTAQDCRQQLQRSAFVDANTQVASHLNCPEVSVGRLNAVQDDLCVQEQCPAGVGQASLPSSPSAHDQGHLKGAFQFCQVLTDR